MGSRHFGELLLRPSSFRIPISQISRPAWRTPASSSWQPQRNLSTSGSAQAVQAQLRTREPRTGEPRTEPEPSTPAQEPYAAPRRPASRQALSGAIDDLFSDVMGTQSMRQPPAREFGDAANRPFGASFSEPGRTSYGRQRLNFDDMASVPSDPTSAPSSTAAAFTDVQKKEPEHYPRLNASYGRSVDLDASRGRDIVRGLGMLSSLVARNRVKNDFHRQKFHERAGLKRKRLNSERWRARFKKGFNATVQRVSDLTRKGW